MFTSLQNNMCSLQAFKFTLRLLHFLSLAIVVSSNVSITSVRDFSEYRTTKVLLTCTTTEPGQTYVFYRRLGTSTNQVITNTTGTANQLSFELSPELEGFYFCQVNDVNSFEIELVAYPNIVPEIHAITLYSTPLGKSAIIHCPYKQGQLRDRYKVKWYQGLTQIGETPEFSRYIILDNFSLVINNTIPTDAKSYSCQMEVTVDNQVITAFGPAAALEITDPLRITQSLADRVVLTSETAQFTCSVVGMPRPEVRWFVGNVDIQGNRSKVVTSTPNSTTVISSLFLTNVEDNQTGSVSCVAYHSVKKILAFAVSSANLIVLTNRFEVSISPETSGTINIHALLPATIPGVFSLKVQFIYDEVLVHQREMIQPSFKNTNGINILVPRELLPTFTQFWVTIALVYDGIVGPSTARSNRIALREAPPSITENNDTPTANQSTTYALISMTVLVVFLAIVLVPLGICAFRKKVHNTVSATSPYSHDSSIKNDYSINQSSYGSESSLNTRSSRSFSRSRSFNSGHDSGSQYSSATDSDVNLEYPRDETTNSQSNHIDLVQLGRLETNQVSPLSVSPGPEASIESPYELIEYYPPPKKDVFTTDVTVKTKKNKPRQSGSSFEEMELDDTPLPPSFKMQ